MSDPFGPSELEKFLRDHNEIVRLEHMTQCFRREQQTLLIAQETERLVHEQQSVLSNELRAMQAHYRAAYGLSYDPNALWKNEARAVEAALKGHAATLAQQQDVARMRLLRELQKAALASRRKVHIAQPPGGWMLRFARVVFSKKTREHVFEQAVQDFRDEYCEALSEGADRTRLFFLGS